MKVSFVAKSSISDTLKKLIKDHQSFYWSVAWASANSVLSQLMQHHSKIEKLVIGTHFYQTPPSILDNLKNTNGVRVMTPDGATFHPKTYLFVSPEQSALVIGSANFTRAAMTSNVEACCLIEGASDEAMFQDAQKFVSGTCWENAQAIDEDFLRDYRLQHAAAKKARKRLSKFVTLKQPNESANLGDPLTMDWVDFAKQVREEEFFENRIKVLSKARALLDNVDRFEELTSIERKALAGTLAENEEGPDDLDWGLFGSMLGFGVLREILNKTPAKIGDSLDCIPAKGPVTENDYNDFKDNYIRAFEGQSRKGTISSASRFLAIKRPDYFVCIDKMNKRGLSAHFGFAASTVNYDNYWQRLIEPITLSHWWQAKRPIGLDGQIWDGRAAFLDALFYKRV